MTSTKRMITLYVVAHTDSPPAGIYATVKEAKITIHELQEVFGKCQHWSITPHEFTDNSSGMADFAMWLMHACFSSEDATPEPLRGAVH